LADRVTSGEAETGWPEAVHRVLQAQGVSQIGTVPDAGLTRLRGHGEADTGVRVSTRRPEVEGGGQVTGARLGGGRAARRMQSPGGGNVL
jgi:sulfopyruvate decarboxylase TPP-binding subunit